MNELIIRKPFWKNFVPKVKKREEKKYWKNILNISFKVSPKKFFECSKKILWSLFPIHPPSPMLFLENKIP